MRDFQEGLYEELKPNKQQVTVFLNVALGLQVKLRG
ncbi:hypothetical protein SAMN04487780_11324 [Bacillus thuringiensis]|nr:hypothetical protein SAMN04487780_11324 [Bacillus thuringiensis]